MSTPKTPTFEDVDKHIQGVKLADYQPGGQHHPQAAAAVTPGEICAAYKMVKPILLLIASIPLIPQKWRDALTVFIGIADRICP